MSTFSANRSELSPLRFLERSATVFPNHIAIVYGDRQSTYADLDDEVQRLALSLRSRIAPGDRVAFLAPNLPELLIAHFAVPLAGGVLVAINSRLARPEVEYILNHCEAKLFFADRELLSNLDGLQERVPHLERVIQLDDPTVEGSDTLQSPADIRYSQFVRADSPSEGERLPYSVHDENAVISINYTSGTTGNPKGVMYSHRGAYLAAMGAIVHNRLDRQSVYLWTLPMFHCNGWCAPWAVTGAAATHVCLRAVRGDAIWRAIDDLAVTHLWGAPTVLSAIANADGAHTVARPLQITTAGAPPSPTIIAQMESLGMSVVHVYGLTEVYGPFTIAEFQHSWAALPVDERAALIARQGVGMIQAESARVVDSEMRDVPSDGRTFGEIILRGNNVMLGYYKDPEATSRAFSGGWFHTGDLGVMHEDGYIQVKDRAKDIVISGGENISSVEVEQAIVSHPDVLEAAVVGVPDEKWGERPRAFIVPHAGRTVRDEDIIQHLRALLAGYKIPRDIVIVDDLPHTSTGKVLKYELRGRQ